MYKTAVKMDVLRWLDTGQYCVVRIQVPSTAPLKKPENTAFSGLFFVLKQGFDRNFDRNWSEKPLFQAVDKGFHVLG